MSRKIIYIGLGVGLVCTILLRAALVPGARTDNPAVELAENTSTAWQMQPVADTAAPAPATQPAPVAQKSVPAKPAPEAIASDKAILAAGDGKETLPAVGEDGKEVLPADGKESLPPVGELIGQRTGQQVDPNAYGPPVEFLNRPSSGGSSSNPLLNPPNPVNVGGPVVSADTRD